MTRRSKPLSPSAAVAPRTPGRWRTCAAPAAPGGNARALRHGAYRTLTREQIDSEVEAIYRALSDSAPLRADDGRLPLADEAAVEIAAKALKRYRDVATWLDNFGRFDEKTGATKSAAEHELRCEAALHRALDPLGMNPAARARLGLDVARAAQFDLAKHWQEGDE